MNGFSGITLAYNGKSKQEVDEVFVKAEKAGAISVKHPEPVFWGGYSGYFRDPNGFYWEVAYGENWQFDGKRYVDCNRVNKNFCEKGKKCKNSLSYVRNGF